MTGSLDGDTVVRVIGLLMALMLVLSNGRLRTMSSRSKFAMAAVWAVLITAAALLFSGFHR